MNVSQKQFMQLFGEWGYTPAQLMEKAKSIKVEAMKRDDGVGAVASETLASACIFAEHDDPLLAYGKVFDAFSRQHGKTKMADLLKAAIKENFGIDMTEQFTEVDFSVMMLESTYARISSFKDFDSAFVYMRQNAFCSIGKDAFIKILGASDIATSTILKMLVNISLAKYEKESGMSVDYSLNRLAMRAFDYAIEQLLIRKDEILDIPNAIHPDFSPLVEQLVGILYTDMPSHLNGIDKKMTDCLNLLPHEMVNFKIDYFFVLSAFLVGISLGIFTYDDYDSLLTFGKNDNELLDAEDVDRIDRQRNN